MAPPPPRARCLRADERSVGARACRRDLPIVAEPPPAACGGGVYSLRQAFEAHGSLICHWLDLHGAVLLRGWAEVDSPAAFADALEALPLTVLRDYLPAEAGREPVIMASTSCTAGCGSALASSSASSSMTTSSAATSSAAPSSAASSSVAFSRATIWPTNKLRRTGGYWGHEVLPHTELFYSLSVDEFGADAISTDEIGADNIPTDEIGADAISAEHLVAGERGHLTEEMLTEEVAAAGRTARRWRDSVPRSAPRSAPRSLSAEAPTALAFHCEVAPWLGGETALFDGVGPLRQLPRSLTDKLRRPHAVRRLLTLDRLRRRHGVGAEQLAELRSACARAGASLRLVGSGAAADEVVEISFARAALVEGPRPKLHLNFGEFGAAARWSLLHGLLQRGLFAGWRWAMHRALWTLALLSPPAARLLQWIDRLPGALRHPLAALRDVCEQRAIRRARAELLAEEQAAMEAAAVEAAAGVATPAHKRGGRSRHRRRAARRRPKANDDAAPQLPTLGEMLCEREGEQLGQALAEHASIFYWQRGDVLLVDNTHVLHDGLPGLGPRRLWVSLLGRQTGATCKQPQP